MTHHHAQRMQGLTLVECLMAMAVLAIATLGLAHVMVAGHQHLRYSDASTRGVRLAEHLMEEIASRPYQGSGSPRVNWHLNDYDHFVEPPGELKDCFNVPYGPQDQAFERRVTLTPDIVTVAQLGDLTLQGRTVTITVTHTGGDQWQLTRFIPMPASP